MPIAITLNHANINEFLHSPSGPVHREVASIVRKTEALAKIKAPVDEGRLRSSGTSSVTDEGARIVGRVVFPVDYALYVHEGTGIYGPRGTPITPKRGKFLVFRGRNGELVFARSVKGMRGRPFLVDALKAASPWPVNER